MADWKTHSIQQLNGKQERIRLSAKHQILMEDWAGGWTENWTESWNRVAVLPFIAYIPEKNRILMLVSCGVPHQAVVLASDDWGGTWGEPIFVHSDESGKGNTGFGVALAYLGCGKASLWTWRYWCDRVEERRWLRWHTQDYGQTWRQVSSTPLPGNGPWDPPLVESDPKTGQITRLWETAYLEDHSRKVWSQAYLRQSVDEGRSWSEWLEFPQWAGVNEVALIRAKNGDLIGACRTDMPDRFVVRDPNTGAEISSLDHCEGLGVCISRDEGRTWSEVERLYEYGRHHPSLVLLSNGTIVMTYVARQGYVETPDGAPQFGVEAVVSEDNGRSWDLDHRYILSAWPGDPQAPKSWFRSSQATSSVLLPDGSILSAYGTGYRAMVPEDDPGRFKPRDVGLVNWRVNNESLDDDRTIANAAFDSDLRNRFDPLLSTL